MTITRQTNPVQAREVRFMTRSRFDRQLNLRDASRLIALAVLATLGSCGIADDSVPRDIDPTKLESLKPTP
jgi:hypothetical protein